eukprot:TRINITY_DN114145_c0_g1_i1.p1 TRINITY_DN114145_c0_g1~~TRINITY_DN114145_c0_g1_i1.p1  ORF type:complete len:317 (+),score=48.98 TRINITY_DN114145_c0_g1_i1:117-953(+)
MAAVLRISLAGLSRWTLLALPSFGTYWAVTPLGPNPLMDALMLVFSTLAGLSYLPAVEKDFGTLVFSLWLSMVSMLIAVMYLLAALCLMILDKAWYEIPCCGLWPVTVFSMTGRSLSAGAEDSASIFGLFKLPARWYPLIFIAFISLLQMRPQLDLLSAWLLAVGAKQAQGGMPLHPLLMHVKIPLHKVLPSCDWVAALESGSFGGGQTLAGKMSAQDRMRSTAVAVCRALARSSPEALRKHYVCAGNARGSHVCPPGVAGSRSFEAFGGSGQRLGDV